MEQFKLYDDIICIDIKSFFAVAECSFLNLDPFKTDLVVCDSSRNLGSIILAISPSLKNKGVSTRTRLHELKRKNIKTRIVKPRMGYYVKMSNKILELYLQYFSKEDILVYSIDEVFIDVTSYKKLYNKSTYEIAKFLLDELQTKLKVPACCGIGNNMLLAKLALDIEAKKNPDNIAYWTYDDLSTKLWPITNLTKVWGIGNGLNKKLNDMGIMSMYDLAHCDIYKLVKKLGYMGEELYLHSHGIDISKIQDQVKAKERQGYSIGQTLFKDTPKFMVTQLFKDLVFQISWRLRNDYKVCNTIKIYVRYAQSEYQASFGMQRKLSQPTFDVNLLMQEVLDMFDKHVLDLNIRQLAISCSGVTQFSGTQLNIFDYEESIYNADLDFAFDYVNIKYGANTIFRASVLTKDSEFLQRARYIGGHNAK